MKNFFSTRLSFIICLFLSLVVICACFLIYSYKLSATEYDYAGTITAILLDQSEFVTHPGQGYGGADASACISPNVNNGFNANKTAFFWVADDFVVPNGFYWQIDSVKFFAYQGGSPPPSPSPILNSRVIILKGNNNNPDSTGSIVAYGDTNTNRMKRTAFANTYRVPMSNLLDTQRPVDIVVDTLNAMLSAGTYWLKYNFNGNATYTGPWGPVRTILGTNNTGNAKQKVPGVGWINIIDTGSQTTKGMIFVIYGVQTSVIGIKKTGNNIPSNFSLSQNYPNPFNPFTKINFNIAKSGFVSLKVYNIMGKEVALLVNSELEPGEYNYQFDASKLPSGNYFYRLNASGFSETKQMVLIK
jgi:hypothetical protein